MNRDLVAFVFLQTEPHGFDAPSLLARIPEVEELHRVAGEDCYVARVRAANTEALGHLVRDKIERIRAVTSTRTTLVLKTLKERGVSQRKPNQSAIAGSGR